MTSVVPFTKYVGLFLGIILALHPRDAAAFSICNPSLSFFLPLFQKSLRTVICTNRKPTGAIRRHTSGLGLSHHTSILMSDQQPSESTGSSSGAMKITMPTTTHVFHYKNIPYQMGLRHIHALEHVSDIHMFSLPFFKLKQTSAPVTYGPSTLISCECDFLGQTKTLRMFTQKPNESQLICFLREGVPHIHIHLTVSPLELSTGTEQYAKNRGHTLTVVCTYYRSPKWIYMQLKPFFDFLHFMEDNCFWSYDFRFRKEDPNLAKYRRTVLYTFKKSPSRED